MKRLTGSRIILCGFAWFWMFKFLFAGIQTVTFATPSIKDSLKHQLTYSAPDTNKVWMLRDIAYYYQPVDSDSAIHYGRRAFQLATEIDFVQGQIWSLYQEALAREIKYGIDSAFTIYHHALQIADQHDDNLSIAKLYNAMGVAHYYAGNYHYAVAWYHQAYELSDSIAYLQGVNHALNNLGVIYRLQRRYEQALDMYNRSLDIKIMEGDSIGMINTLYNMGLAYSYLQDYENSLKYLQRAEQLSWQASGISHDNLANISIGIGVALYNMDDIEDAEMHLKAGLEKISRPGSHEWIAALNYLGAVDVKRNNPVEGLEKIKRAYNAALASGRLELLRQTLREKAVAASLIGDHALAHNSWMEHSILVDSLTQESKLWAQEEMQVRFELADKLKTIRFQEELLLKESRKKKMYFRLGMLLSVLLIAGGVILRTNSKHRKQLLKTVALNEVALTEDRQLKLQRFCKVLPEPLSKRELEVLRVLEQGLTNREMAERLFLSEHTIKSHLKNIFVKTGVKNRTELLSKLN